MNKQVLNHSIKIYCPAKDNDGNDLTELNNSVVNDLCYMFNGLTQYSANGLWVDNSVKYSDDMNIYVCFSEIEIKEHHYDFIVERILNDGNQYAVSIELDNVLMIYSK